MRAGNRVPCRCRSPSPTTGSAQHFGLHADAAPTTRPSQLCPAPCSRPKLRRKRDWDNLEGRVINRIEKPADWELPDCMKQIHVFSTQSQLCERRGATSLRACRVSRYPHSRVAVTGVLWTSPQADRPYGLRCKLTFCYLYPGVPGPGALREQGRKTPTAHPQRCWSKSDDWLDRGAVASVG